MKKVIFGVIIFVLVILIGVAGFIGIKMLKKTASFDYSLYVYAKENTLILWNQKTDEKYVLSNQFTAKDSKDYDYFKLSEDQSKIIYVDDIKESGMKLKVANLNDVMKKEDFDYQLIEKDITSYEVVKEGIIYLKGENLYYYDYEESVKIASEVKEFLLNEAKSLLLYRTEDDDAYQIEIGKYDSKEKIASDILQIASIQNSFVMTAGEAHSSVATFYKDKEKVTDRYREIVTFDDSGLYFIAYEGNNPEVLNAPKTGKQTIKKISEITDEKAILVFGSKNCSHCKNLENNLNELANYLSFSYYYLEATTLTDEDLEKLANLYGSSSLVTPLILGINNGTLSMIQVGEADTSTLYSLLQGYENKAVSVNPDKEVATYRYYDGKTEKIADGIYCFDENFKLDNVSDNEYLLFYEIKDEGYYYFLFNQKTKEKIEIPFHGEFITYDDKTKTIYYQEKENYYQRHLENGTFTEPEKLLGIAISLTKNDDSIYLKEYQSNNLFLLKNDKIEKIDDNVDNYYISKEQLYYRKEANDKYELYCYKCNINFIPDVDDVIRYDDLLFYYEDTRTSKKTALTTGNLYYMNGTKQVFVDSDVQMDFYVREVK